MMNKKSNIQSLNENLQEIVDHVNNDFIVRAGSAAKKMGCHIRTIYRMVERGDLQALKLSEKKIRISRTSVESKIEENTFCDTKVDKKIFNR